MDKTQFFDGVIDHYPEKLLERRALEEGNVCGCLLQDLSLYDDCVLNEKDFLTKSGRLLFRIGKVIRKKHCNIFDEVTFLSKIKPEVIEKINDEFGGFRQIKNVMDNVPLSNYDAFLDDLIKSNNFLALSRKNIDLLKPMTLDNGKEVVPYELFKKFSSSEVLDFYDGTLATLNVKNNSSKIVDEGYVDFDDNFLSSLKNKEEVGVSFADAGSNVNGEVIRTFPFMSSNILGVKHGTLNCWAAHSGAGKSTYMITILMSLISKGEYVSMITNESALNDIKAQFLIWVLTRCLDYWDLTKKKLISGNINERDLEKIQEAREYWKANYAKSVRVTALSDADAKLTCQIIKKDITRRGCTCFLVDTFKLSIDGNNDEAFWMSLIKDTRALTEIAMKYQVVGLMTVQLALNSLNRCWIDASCLSNSKAIKETLSNLVMFRKVTDTELDPDSPYFIRPFRHKQDDEGNWYEEPYEPDRSKVWRLFFLDKCRRGSDSNDTGIAYLVRYDGDYCCFYETSKARPTHKLINTGGD